MKRQLFYTLRWPIYVFNSVENVNSIQEFIALISSWTYGNWIRSWGTRTTLCHLLVFCKLFFLSTPWTRIQGRNFKLFELKLSCQTEDNLELLGNSERLWNIKLYSGVHIHLVSFFISLINWLCSSFLLTTCIVIDWQPRICTFTKVIISFHRFNWQVVTFIEYQIFNIINSLALSWMHDSNMLSANYFCEHILQLC